MHVSYLIKQKPKEKVIFALHRHSITFVPIIFLFLLLLLIPVVVYFLLLNVSPALITGDVTKPVLILLGSIYYLSIALFFYGMFIDFHLDVWVITNERIVDIEQHGLLSRSISEIELHNIQDVTTDVHGVFQTVFHYGDVTVKTSSDTADIVFRKIPYPNKIREHLIKLSRADRKYHYSNAMKHEHGTV